MKRNWRSGSLLAEAENPWSQMCYKWKRRGCVTVVLVCQSA